MSSGKIVITGAAGFIGSYLIKSFLREGFRAESFVLVDTLEHFETRSCFKDLRFYPFKLIDKQEFIESLDLKKRSTEIIFHIGACSSTEESNWDYLLENNVEYSKKIWRHCTKQKVPLAYASSAATYGDGSLGFDDDPRLIPKLEALNLYGKSKQLFDEWILDQKQTPPQWWGFKFFNVYGPGEEHKGSQASVVLHASRQLLNEGCIRLFKSHNPDYKDGEQMRDFVSVEDVARVCHFVYKEGFPSGIYNLGSGKARNWKDLAHAVAAALKKDCKIEYIPTPQKYRKHYQYFTEAKMDRLRKAGYKAPFLSLEEGVRRYFQQEKPSL